MNVVSQFFMAGVGNSSYVKNVNTQFWEILRIPIKYLRSSKTIYGKSKNLLLWCDLENSFRFSISQLWNTFKIFF